MVIIQLIVVSNSYFIWKRLSRIIRKIKILGFDSKQIISQDEQNNYTNLINEIQLHNN